MAVDRTTTLALALALALTPAAALASPAAAPPPPSPPPPPPLPRAARTAAPQLPVLIFTTRGWAGVDFLEAALRAYSIPYNTVAFDPDDRAARPFVDLSRLLWDDAGAASRWAGLVSYPNVEAMGYLNRSEVATLWRWQAQTRVRSVKFGAWATYVGFVPDMALCGDGGTGLGALPNLTFTPTAPFSLSGERLPAGWMSGAGLYRCPGIRTAPLPTCSIWGSPGSDFERDGIHPNCTSTPVITLSPGAAAPRPRGGAAAAAQARAGPAGAGAPSADPVAAVLVNYTDDSRECLAFVFDCAAWSPSCSLLGRLAAAWMLEPRPPAVGAAGAGGAAGGGAAAANATCSSAAADAAACAAVAQATGDPSAAMLADLLVEVKLAPAEEAAAAPRAGGGAAAGARPGAAAAGAALLLAAALVL
ncbi:hypothetical protein Rsub_09205 [Raphidocelis subcapitata]|uniref:Uncharacterized protein n=1 Tax=Raphidocelis subcapitata TaxID=307507 RepID=A0A2V0P988_9CHLO|nr:hypothetical protein Rsub_09205 [Raphidocelis subcapitata]|eukprot:GBF96406.1 hypothetical protein Rsub_09205 [Raphidocelis subcapitata]